MKTFIIAKVYQSDSFSIYELADDHYVLFCTCIDLASAKLIVSAFERMN